MLPYPHSPGHYLTLCHCHSCNPAIIVTIDALGKSDGIQNLKITDLCRHLLFDSTDPALLAGVDDDDDTDTSLAGVQGDDTSLAGVPIPVATNNDNSVTESNHNSIDPNMADDNSSKASIHSTRSQAPVHNMTDEPPQLPPDEEEPDDTHYYLSWKPNFPYYINLKEFVYHCLTTYPEWEARPMR